MSRALTDVLTCKCEEGGKKGKKKNQPAVLTWHEINTSLFTNNKKKTLSSGASQHHAEAGCLVLRPTRASGTAAGKSGV